MKYQTLKNLAGWIVFLIALLIYVLTLEPANSLWDCSEFIACAYKLQVSHAPGAPLFMMIARLFTLLAGKNPANAAIMVNLFSAITSALTIMFLFWTITIFADKAFDRKNFPERKHIILAITAGLAGSMSFAFTDSFWFSAVEAEVYAFSSFLTALTFWAILLWDNQSDPVRASRWLIFIAFVISLSIGVHLLSLLVIPAIVFIMLSKNKNIRTGIILKSLIISVLVLGFLMITFIPGIARAASVLDLFFVNTMNMPPDTGFYIFYLITGIFLTFILFKAIKAQNLVRQTVILSAVFMIIGYTSYFSILLRSKENISVDMDNPDNPFSLYYYLNREHYGSRPLFYGPYYNAPVTGVEKRSSYVLEDGKYIKTELNPKYLYDKRFMTIFPRMGDNTDKYIKSYKYWGKVRGRKVTVYRDGKAETLIKPIFSENIRFFLRYQLGYMYWRYFLWNFAGRQDDVQGTGDVFHGNWISGIGFIDRLRLGSQEGLQQSINENKARNRYFFLPLLAGILGLLWHYRNSKRDFTAILLLFLFTGMAVNIYLNEIPATPRERDYAFSGSFYAFSIWLGFGVIALFSFLKKYLSSVAALFFSFIAAISVPAVLVFENYDDHDRSDRYLARDIGYNYLNSCKKNAVLFTNGDNDTYPLWYNQEVEGVRTDIRVVLQPYLGADWYINQMRRGINNAGALPVTFGKEKFREGKRSVIPVINRINRSVELREALEFIKSDNPGTKLMINDSNSRDYLPANNLKLTLDKQELAVSGNFTEEELAKTGDSMHFSINSGYLLRSDLLILDIITGNNWKRTLYFLNPFELRKLGLDKYLVKEGFAYRLVPYENGLNESAYTYPLDTRGTYNKLMHQFRWGNIECPHVYVDYTMRQQIEVMGIRRTFSQLTESLIKKGEIQKARSVLDRCMELIPLKLNNDDYYITRLIALYFKTGNKDKGSKWMNEYALILNEELQYYTSAGRNYAENVPPVTRNYLYYLNELILIAEDNDLQGFDRQYRQKFQDYYNKLALLYKNNQTE